MVIYKITHIVTGKIYIGQTINNPKRRWQVHISKTNQSYVGRAIKKHGENNFIFEVIDKAKDVETLNWLEQKYIAEYDCLAPKGYNLQPGGNNHSVHEVTRRKISESTKKAMKCPKIKEKIRAAVIGHIPWNKGKKGLKITRTLIKCVETEEIFTNQTRVAEFLGLSKSSINAHLQGRLKNLKGLTFVRN